ncbi:MAG: phytanoyl-CoA dioxygenase family protein [Planctomycetaceae bacterium]
MTHFDPPANDNALPPEFSADELNAFERDGYLIVRGMVGTELRDRMLAATMDGIRGEVPPLEYEADLHYPGAPESLRAEGGKTIRRLKDAYRRHPAFAEWANRPDLNARLKQLLGSDVYLPLAHHNCVMTKQPHFSSDTGWHQDIRYWSFARPELVSVWLALTSENVGNGCLQVIPGTHRMEFDRRRFDDDLFFRNDMSENQALIATRKFVELDPGDVLFFHCRTLHAATRNQSGATKVSVVFTFRPGDNPPISGSRSTSLPEIPMAIAR